MSGLSSAARTSCHHSVVIVGPWAVESLLPLPYLYTSMMPLASSAAILPPSSFIGDQTEKEDLWSLRGNAADSSAAPACCESQTLVAERGVKSSGSVLCRARYPARLTKGESFLNGLQRRGKDSLCSAAGGKASPALQHAPRPTDDPQVVYQNNIWLQMGRGNPATCGACGSC